MPRSTAPCSCQSLPLARTGGQALGPRFRGDDENLPSLPSEERDGYDIRNQVLAPCPFGASSAVRIIGKQHARAIACENCYVEASPGWRQQTDANFAAFWTRCRHPGAYTLDPHL